jgi:DedD protein
VVILVVVLAMVEGTHEEAGAPTAHTVTSTGVTGQQTGAQSPSLAEATTEALRTSSEAAELQSAVMAEQQATASAAAAAPVVPEGTAEPLGVPAQTSAPLPVTSRRQTSGRLVLEQSPPKPAHANSSSSIAAAPAKAAPPLANAANSAAPAGFVVQVGVFANPGNAEELRAKLKAAGIPTQVETRVQVGPFNTRQEAVAAQAKLKSLGLDAGMVLAARH